MTSFSKEAEKYRKNYIAITDADSRFKSSLVDLETAFRGLHFQIETVYKEIDRESLKTSLEAVIKSIDSAINSIDKMHG